MCPDDIARRLLRKTTRRDTGLNAETCRVSASDRVDRGRRAEQRAVRQVDVSRGTRGIIKPNARLDTERATGWRATDVSLTFQNGRVGSVCQRVS